MRAVSRDDFLRRDAAECLGLGQPVRALEQAVPGIDLEQVIPEPIVAPPAAAKRAGGPLRPHRHKVGEVVASLLLNRIVWSRLFCGDQWSFPGAHSFQAEPLGLHRDRCRKPAIEGEQDHLFNIDWLYRTMRELVCARSVTARIFTAREGAEQHCQVGNSVTCT